MTRAKSNPPWLACLLFKCLFRGEEYYEKSGDIEEVYRFLSEENCPFKAKVWYWLQVIQLLLLFIKNSLYWSVEMFKNYLKIALRTIRRKMTYSFINILGLAMGMACFFLILLYVQHEFSYDRFHEKSDQIYRIKTEWQIEGQSQIHNTTAAPVAPALLNDFSGIADVARVRKTGAIINHEDQSFVERQVYLVDPSFFDLFTFPLIRGNPQAVLSDKKSIVLTEKMAEKYFGEEDPVGKTLTFQNRFDFTVTGIVKNAASNSHLKFDFLVRFDLINDFSDYDYLGSWGAWNFLTYILVREDFPLSEFEEKSTAFIKKYRGEDATNPQCLHLQPLTKIHLEEQGRTQYINIFSAIAVFILLLACINFMNLALAQSSTRAREVGMRKVIGALRHQLIKQFLGESIVFAFMTFPLALLLVKVLLPSFNALFMTQLKFDFLQNLPFIGTIIGITLLLGIISGSYPAFYQSAIQPVQSLRGEFRSGSKVSFLRSSLIIFQFSISIALMVCTVVIYNQMSYIREINLGFDREHVINVPIYDRELKQKMEYVRSELLENPKISGVTASSFWPGSYPNQSVDWEGRKEDEELMMAWYSVDHDFIKTFQIQMVKGRDFSRDFPSDMKFAYILNESAAKAFGWESPIGKQFQVERADLSMGRVIGVMKDFHFASLHHEIRPLALVLDPEGGSYFSLKIALGNIPATIDFIKKKFNEFAPNAPFDYYFLDAEIDDMYRTELRLGKLIKYLSGLAIFIACLGLLGLTSFTITQKTKEIGIRKVLGASVSDIFLLLSKNFTRLVALANIIAWPIAYYAMHKWLQNFAYRSSLSVWIFLMSGAVALVIALLTIIFQSINAATANPVDSLRYE